MRLHDSFEWDEDKAVKNLRKHGVSFDDAALALADEAGDIYHIDEYDSSHSNDEDRFITTASHPADRRIVSALAGRIGQQAASGSLASSVLD
jgi:uncharacterized protein